MPLRRSGDITQVLNVRRAVPRNIIERSTKSYLVGMDPTMARRELCGQTRAPVDTRALILPTKETYKPCNLLFTTQGKR